MKENQSEVKINSLVESSIRKSKGITTPSDLAADTGLSLDIINDSLMKMLEIFEAKVKMNDKTGSLEFKFEYPLKRRSKKSFKEVMYIVSQKLWEIFKKIYRASFGILLIFYTIVFMLILLGGRGNNRSSSSSSSSANIPGGAFLLIFQLLRFSSFHSPVERVTDKSGFRYRKPVKEKNKGKSFLISVFNFVLGPERADIDPLSDTKEVLAYVKFVSNGRLTAADIVHLSGVDYDKAESLLAEYAGKFKGELQINEDGYVVCYFSRIRQEKIKNVSESNIVHYYDEIEAPYKLTGNTAGKNVIIILMNIFNLMMSLMMFSFFDYPIIGEPDTVLVVMKIALAWFPFLLSASFFLIPIIRVPFIIIKENQRKENILRKKLFLFIYRNAAKPINYNSIKEFANKNQLNLNQINNILENMLIELRGGLFIDDNGNKMYDFSKFYNELTEK